MDFIRLPNLMLRENYSADNRIKKDKDFEAIKTFIKQRVPDVICIGKNNHFFDSRKLE